MTTIGSQDIANSRCWSESKVSSTIRHRELVENEMRFSDRINPSTPFQDSVWVKAFAAHKEGTCGRRWLSVPEQLRSRQDVRAVDAKGSLGWR